MRRVVITGLGAVTPLGNDVGTFWNALLAGTSGANLITKFDTTLFKTKFACELKNFDPLNYIEKKEVSRLDPSAIYAIAAGIAHGLGYGDNFQAVLVTAAIGEIERFIDSVHEVHRDVFAEIEVEIDFRTTTVRVRGHRVPDAAGFEFGEAKDELAALDAVGVNILQDRAAIGLGDVADGRGGDVGTPGKHRGVFRVGGRADEIKLSLTGGAVFQGDVFFAEPDVETIQRGERVRHAADADDAGTRADVEDADLATLEEKRGADFLVVWQSERGGRGDRGADDHTIEIGVMRDDRARLEEPADVESFAELLGGERVGRGGRGKIMEFHVGKFKRGRCGRIYWEATVILIGEAARVAQAAT